MDGEIDEDLGICCLVFIDNKEFVYLEKSISDETVVSSLQYYSRNKEETILSDKYVPDELLL